MTSLETLKTACIQADHDYQLACGGGDAYTMGKASAKSRRSLAAYSKAKKAEFDKTYTQLGSAGVA